MSSRPNILCIDDDPTVLSILQARLEEREGWKTTVVNDGYSAINIAKKTRPDAILLDWKMPNYHGMQVLEVLRSQDETKEIPIVVLTADAQMATVEEAFGTGATDFLSKPLDLDLICKRLKKRLPQLTQSFNAGGRIRNGSGWARLTGLLPVCLLLIAIMFSSNARADVNLSFGVYAFERPSETVRKLRPILDELEDAMSSAMGERINIKMQVAKNYQAGIDQIAKNEVHFGRYGQAVYVMAKAVNRDLDVIVVEGDEAQSKTKGMIVTGKRSGITNLRDLRGRSIAFGNRFSTTGRFLPQYFLTTRGFTNSTFSVTEHLQRHDQVGWAVSDGRFDAGAIDRDAYRSLIKQGAEIVPVASYESPTMPWVASPTLNQNVRNALRTALISLQGVEVLETIKRDCFLPSGDQHYDQMRLAISENWRFYQ